MRHIVFELCAETIDACIAARNGGADRIELCSGLSEGGITPSHGLVHAAVERSGLPVHALVRPRGGDFLYSASEVSVMADDIVHMKHLGVAGVVFGLLHPDGTVDRDRTRALVELARPMQVTFHRAFDATPSLTDALEDVIALGCDRVLTSGGQRDVIAGASSLAALVQQAADRIQVAAGGGLRLKNAASLARLTGATHFHGSLRRRVTAPKPAPTNGSAVGELAASVARYVVDADSVRSVISRLQRT
jgi:copper homeostasis protein